MQSLNPMSLQGKTGRALATSVPMPLASIALVANLASAVEPSWSRAQECELGLLRALD